jgi:hypothetical protein
VFLPFIGGRRKLGDDSILIGSLRKDPKVREGFLKVSFLECGSALLAPKIKSFQI